MGIDPIAIEIEAGAETLHEICERALDELGTTVPPTQLRALLMVDRLDGPNLNALAHELRASTSATSRLCDRLQAAGLIVRSAGERDRREIVISLSHAGARLVGWAREQRRGRLSMIAESMDDDDRAALVRGLRAFRAASTQGDRAGKMT